jgi:hypothetical protein
VSTKPPRLSEYQDRSGSIIVVCSVLLAILLHYWATYIFSVELSFDAATFAFFILLFLLLYVKTPFIELLLRPSKREINSHVAALYLIGLIPVIYCGVGLSNVIACKIRFGGRALSMLDTILDYGQIFGPNWYVFGWPDMFAAVAMAVILDAIVLWFFPLPSRRLRKLVFAAGVANLLVYSTATLLFLCWLRIPFFS